MGEPTSVSSSRFPTHGASVLARDGVSAPERQLSLSLEPDFLDDLGGIYWLIIVTFINGWGLGD